MHLSGGRATLRDNIALSELWVPEHFFWLVLFSVIASGVRYVNCQTATIVSHFVDFPFNAD